MMSVVDSPFPSPGSSFLPPPVPGPHEFAAIPRKMSRTHNDNAPSSLSLSLSLASSRPAPPSPAISRRASRLDRAPSRPISRMSSTAPSRPLSTTTLPHNRPPPFTTTPTQATTAPALIYIRDFAFPSSDPRFQGLGQHVPRANRPTILARRLTVSSESTPATSSNGEHADSDADYEDVDGDDGDYGCIDDYDCVRPNAEDNDTGEPLGRDHTRYSVFSRVWEDVVDDGPNAWNGFKWGFDRVWAFGRTTTNATTNTTGSAGGFPSQGDLDRNFGAEDDDDSMDVDQEAEPDAYSDDMDDGLETTTDSDIPLVPGLYRALYAFEPEGTAEMRLEEDQLVHVIGRGGGVGWAVVVKDGLKDAGIHALVPESYLEPVRSDGEVEED